MRGPLSAGDTAQLCRDVEALLRAGTAVVLHLEGCDLTVVDAVSRLRLLARNRSARLEVDGERELLAWCGLDSEGQG